ncbi:MULTISPECIES: epoxide hydrolase family protein [Staphylococcaceae]|uniref:epoxide hydrolase family protein n=1 Tax=Staphylococcaceae TaxID=90964 RepID=UPI000452ACA2|nr:MULTISPECIES: epoxide hydrolase [Staphylococcaceae]HBI1454325.1 epoxide hydrolase [Staphylococcus aureus]EZS29348.1 hypothetical protein W603_02576 [Staphylococcus aureus VET0353R]EZU94008.1 hypothetical protein V148_02301 [Staphylococcus aureus 11P8]MBK3720409.1 hypothetical protein [Staphylococcus arlettae]MCZ4237564.1 epoxide hydrolase [Staphylococcus equorum]
MKQNNTKKISLEFQEDMIEDLKTRLSLTRFPDEDQSILNSNSVTQSKMKYWVNYWLNEYDMYRVVKKLNQNNLYSIKEKEHEIYFTHVESQKDNSPLLVLIHGWPDTPLAFFPLIEELSKDFEIIIPSIPGFGISGPVTNMNTDDVAEIFVSILKHLNYQEYFIHGEDFGAVIARKMALLNHGNILGIHVSMLQHANIYNKEQISDNNELEKLSYQASLRYQYELSGYSILQSTKPQDLSYALSDSPAGLLSWIASQFIDWKDPNIKIDIEKLIDTTMIYWVYNTMPSSSRFYKHDNTDWGKAPDYNQTNTFVISTPHDIGIPIQRIAKKYDNIADWKLTNIGGHFVAHEIPNELIKSLLNMKSRIFND